MTWKLVQCLGWVSWSYFWWHKHRQIRKNRSYADGKVCVPRQHRSYANVSIGVFIFQNVICLSSFISRGGWLLPFHESDRVLGAGWLLLGVSTWLYIAALRALGENYSPCFDPHLPRSLTTSGPYRWIRHPMYLAKIGVASGTLLLSVSLWMLPIWFWIAIEVVRATRMEEIFLSRQLRDYQNYQERTQLFVPFVI